jgi:3-hydroxyisobutyrate dehydrogenase
MTTSQPALAERIASLAADKGVAALDAPVSGGDVGAREGTLAIMVGGDEVAYREVLPLFEVMGKTIQLMGPAGAGQHTKTVNQILVAGTMISSVEALLYAGRAGLDLEEVIGVVGKGAAASWTINNLGMRIARNDMDPGFMIRHFVKDLGIALEESRRMQISLPGLALVEQFYQAARAEGLEKNGTQALYRVYQRINSA